MSSFTLEVDAQFSLHAARSFALGFPGTDVEQVEDAFVFAWPLDGEWTTARVHLRQDGRALRGEITGGAPPELVRRDVERILCTDVDGAGFSALASKDPVVAALQEQFPGLRPVLFYTPYEAAAWCIIGHRIRMTQAAAIKKRLAHQLGADGAFPAPDLLQHLTPVKGLTDRKVEQLRHLGAAALNGDLDRDHLRALPYDDALVELQQLAGIGPYSAELIMIRGVGIPDALPVHEKRFSDAVRNHYAVDEISAVAENWRPYRSWVGLLLRASAAEPEKVRH